MAQATPRPATVEHAPQPGEAPPPICRVAFCPVCTAVTALGEARPELVGHLLSAGREILLAIRAVVDARLSGSEPPARLERLTIE